MHRSGGRHMRGVTHSRPAQLPPLSIAHGYGNYDLNRVRVAKRSRSSIHYDVSAMINVRFPISNLVKGNESESETSSPPYQIRPHPPLLLAYVLRMLNRQNQHLRPRDLLHLPSLPCTVKGSHIRHPSAPPHSPNLVRHQEMHRQGLRDNQNLTNSVHCP